MEIYMNHIAPNTASSFNWKLFIIVWIFSVFAWFLVLPFTISILGDSISEMGSLDSFIISTFLSNLVILGIASFIAISVWVLSSISEVPDTPSRVALSYFVIGPGILQMAAEGRDVNLAVSLNATDDKTRSSLMPVNRQYPLKVLMDAVGRFPIKARKRITFEYVLIEDINDSHEDARRLKDLLRDIPAKVNLIPCNDNYSGLKAPSDKRVRDFHEKLLNYGVLATMRKSRGSEINAACGQLKAGAAGK